MYSNAYENDYFMEARRLIENKEFKRAYNFLQSVNDKCSEWYYLRGVSAMNIGYYEDWFGSKYYILDSNDEYTVLACDTNVNAVYYWALQYGNIAKVLEPVELRNRIIRGLKDILKGYE